MMRFTSEKRVMSEINVTPFVDVMLVLLIIFMVTAPLLKQGLDVDLPKAKGKELPAEERIMVSVKKDGKIYLNRRAVSLSELTRKLRAISKRNPTLYLQADRRVPYGEVVKIMGEIKSAGIEKVGLMTEPRVLR
jgi:biopolymer transport protein TolR